MIRRAISPRFATSTRRIIVPPPPPFSLPAPHFVFGHLVPRDRAAQRRSEGSRAPVDGDRRARPGIIRVERELERGKHEVLCRDRVVAGAATGRPYERSRPPRDARPEFRRPLEPHTGAQRAPRDHGREGRIGRPGPPPPPPRNSFISRSTARRNALSVAHTANGSTTTSGRNMRPNRMNQAACVLTGSAVSRTPWRGQARSRFSPSSWSTGGSLASPGSSPQVRAAAAPL